MMAVPPPTDMDGTANGAIESSANPPASQASREPRAKGHERRRWHRIQRKEKTRSAGDAVSDSGAAGDDATQLHKRRLPLGATAPPKGKHEAAVDEESFIASAEPRFVPLEPAPAMLDPDLRLLISFSVGAGGGDSDNSEDRGSRSRSSTAASAPRHGFVRERDRPRAHTAAAATSLRGKSHQSALARADRPLARAAFSPAEADNSRSSVLSDRQSSSAVNGRKPGVGNGVHKVRSDVYEGQGQPSEEVRSTEGGYCTQNGSSVMRRLVQDNGDSGDDAYAESILLLQRTQEALRNEIQNFVVTGKESSDDFDVNDDEWSDSLHLDEPVEEASEKEKNLESRMEQASTLIKEKDSRIRELEALSRTRAWRSAIQSTSNLVWQPDLDRLLQEKMEAEIQCIILTRALQTRTPLVVDRKALYEEQKCLLSDYKQLELKLRRSENRAAVLGEMVEKLEVQCKELSASSEILQLQSRASTLSLFCFIQFILLVIAIGTFLVRLLLPSSTEFIPT